MPPNSTYLSIKDKTVDDVARHANNHEKNKYVIKKFHHRLSSASTDQVPRIVERKDKIIVSTVWMKRCGVGVEVPRQRRSIGCVSGVVMNKHGK